MRPSRLARFVALAAAGLTGLGLCLTCLGTAQAGAAPAAGPAAGQTWFVDNTPGEGLVGYWKFDQFSGSTTLNSAFLSDPTNLTSGASITTSVPVSVSIPNFGSVQLDGVNDAVVANDVPSLDVAPSTFSVAAWVRRTSTGAYHAIYDSGTETNKWWVFIADASKSNRFGFGVRGGAEVYSTRGITDTNWHHLAVVKNGIGPSNMTFYVDGAASGVVTATGVLTPSGPKRIGSLLDPGTCGQCAFFNGQIDELRLYNRALSAAEVGRLAAGRGCVFDGGGWPTAFQDLQCALAAAHPGDQIWIANGTYRPGSSRFASFGLPSGVSLFGGFLGTETSPAQRPAFNPLSVPTALSGDLAGDDQTLTFGNYGENSCNVVKAGSLGLPGSVSATIDGLAIQAGSADAGAGCGNFPSAARGGGLLAIGPSQLSLNNVVFRFNRASDSGGGLSNDFGQLSINDGRFFSNTVDGGISPFGGGLATSGGDVTITASSFVSNSAGQGGAIDLRPTGGHSGLVVSGSSFSTNVAQDGGAVEDQVGAGVLDLAFDHDTFTNNLATVSDGGAMENSGFSGGLVRTRLNQSTFTGNRSSEDGGAIADAGEQLTIDGSHFIHNTGVSNGGALLIQGVLTVTNSTFVSNTTTSVGGGLAVFGTLTLVDSSVTQNSVANGAIASDFAPVGGGVLVSGTALITNSQFVSNTAFLQSHLMDVNLAGGGGLAVTGILVLSGGDFRDNSARQGGGVQVFGSADIRGSLFQNNQAGEGGGVFAEGSLVLATNRLIDNIASLADATNQPGRGGGVFLQNGGFGDKIANNLFLGNQALSISTPPSGAAMLIGSAAILVSNNTIVSHDLITTSAVSFITGAAGLFNNIITSHTVALDDHSSFALFEDYNLFHADTLTATGVISSLGHSRQADPLFIAPQLDDFRVRLNSPAVDAGENDRVPLFVTTDLSGGPRFVDVPSAPDTGAGTPPIVDLGAFEEAGDQLFLPLVIR